MKKSSLKQLNQDHNLLHRLNRFHGIELFEANAVTEAFGKHAHDSFAIGAITRGVGGYWCRGARTVADELARVHIVHKKDNRGRSNIYGSTI